MDTESISIIDQNRLKEYVVCLYIRLSMEDDDVSGSSFKTESGSITTQMLSVKLKGGSPVTLKVG